MRDWGETLQFEEREEALLECVHPGETGGGGHLPLALTARVDDQGFPDAAQFLQHAVDADRLAFPRQFALQ